MEKPLDAFLVLFHVGMWTGYLSVIVRSFNGGGGIPIEMTLDDVSWVVSLTDIGSLICAFPAGYLMNRLGRVLTLRLAFTSFLVAGVLTLGATTPYHMYLASLLVGMGSCLGLSTTALYVAEIAKPNIKGSLGTIGGVMGPVAMAVTMTFGPFISFGAMTLASLVCPGTGLVLTFFIAESPHYYFLQKSEASAAKALSLVRDDTIEKDVELDSIRRRVEDNLADSPTFLELISEKSNKKAFVTVLMVWITRAAGGTACVSIYAPASLPSHYYWDPTISMVIFPWLYVLFTLLGMRLVERFGRKPLLIISLSGLSLAAASSAVFYYFYKNTHLDVIRFAFVPHVGVMLYAMFYPIGIDPISKIYRGELLPVKLKDSASPIFRAVTSLCLFYSNKAYYAVGQSIGVYLMYVIFSTVNIVGLIFTIRRVFETKGKTPDEIQCLLKR